MKRHRLPNSDKRNVYKGLVSVLGQCGLSPSDAVRVIEAGNPSLHAMICRWIAADPLYKRCGLCLESFRRALGLWIAYKAGVPDVASSDEMFVELEGSANDPE